MKRLVVPLRVAAIATSIARNGLYGPDRTEGADFLHVVTAAAEHSRQPRTGCR